MKANRHIVCTVTNDLNQDQRMARICTTLADYGYHVTLVGRQKGDSLPYGNPVFKWKRLDVFFNSGFLFYAEYNIRLLIYLLKRRNDIDIIYTVDTDTLAAGGIFKFLTSKKQIFDAHEYFTEVPELQDRRFVKWFWNMIEIIFVPRANAHISVNRSLAEILGNKFKKVFTPIMNVPFLNKASNSNSDKVNKTILYQGMLNKGRGLEQMIYAIEKISNAELNIIGEGDLSEYLRKIADESPAKKRIHFLGWIDSEQMAEYTNKASLAVNLLDGSSKSYYFSLANKFFDYIHAGVPSVNMDFPEYRHIIGKYSVGITIPNLDIETIAAAINNLLSNPEKRDQMAKECIKAKLVYNWETERKKLMNIIDSL